MYKIATLNKISPVGLEKLTADYEITTDVDAAHGILLRSQNIKEMEFSGGLLAIARAGAGVNNIPIERCAKEGIVVFNTPGANANAVKELVLTGMLLAARNVPAGIEWAKTLADPANTAEFGSVAKTVEKGKGQFAGSEIAGKTLGVIGLGAIGVMVSNAAENLGMDVIGYDPFITLKAAHRLSNTIEVVTDLKDLLPRCDFITIHVPALDSTKGMIDQSAFAQMKDGTILLNFARDTLVNTPDLLDALETGKLRKYVVDFPTEDVMGVENIIALPHLGASTTEAEDNCATMATLQLMDYIENGNIENSVNFPSCDMGEKNGARICIINENVPNMLGQITAALSSRSINIENMMNKSRGEIAYTMVEVDDVDKEDIEAALAFDGIISVRVIK